MKDIVTSTPEIERAVRLALADMLGDADFTHHLAEEIADRLAGIEDERFALVLDHAAETSGVVSEEDIHKALSR